jgi:3',5'-cyclic AMP phosphodiesterase CpdA
MEASNVLENDRVRLEVSPQNGSITRLLDKQTGTDYINDQAQSRLFRFLLPKPDYLARRINAHDQKADSVEVENGVLKIRYRQLQIARQKYLFQVGIMEVPEPQLDIDVTVTFQLDGEHILGKLQVNNRSLEEITDVTFPWLGGLASTADQQRAKVVLPSLSQKTISSTGDVISAERAKRYPGLLATTWMNYEFEDKGVGIEVRSLPESQDALFSLNPGVFGGSDAYSGASGSPYIAWNSYPHIPGQSQWVSPEVIIHVHGSDWHTMASEHREWYRERFSPPRSGAFDHSIGFATYRLKRDDNTVNWTYDEIPKLAEEAKAAGIRHLVIAGWREREGPGNPCPFGEFADPRMGGGARLKALIERLHQQGVELAFAFHPTLINTAAKQYRERALRWTVKSRRQGNQLSPSFTYISQDYPYEDYAAHYWAQLDPASPATDYLLEEAKRLQSEYGFRNLFLQGVGLQSFLSYNQDDAAAPQEVYVRGYEQFLGGLRKIFPHGLLLMEGLNDLVNQYGSAGYTWSQTDDAEILALSVPWMPFSHDVEALNYDQANASFARKILINLIVDGGDGSVSRYGEFARHLKALQDLKAATVPYYADAEFRDGEGLKKLDADSGVIVSVFHNRSSQQVGIVAANLTKDKKTVSFELEAPLSQAKGKLFRPARQPEEFSLLPKASVDLGPFGVALVGIDRKAGAAG